MLLMTDDLKIVVKNYMTLLVTKIHKIAILHS